VSAVLGADAAAVADAPRRHTATRVSSSLLRSLWRAVVMVVPVFLLATFATFMLQVVSGLTPAAVKLGESATPELVAQLNEEWGLDRPLVVQYLDWLGSLLRGDLGTSWFSGFSVSEMLSQRIAISLSVAGLALVIAMTFGTLLGFVAALHRGTWIDRGITAFTTVVSTMPAFVVGVGLIAVFAVVIPVFPAAGYVPFADDPVGWLIRITLPAVALSLDTVADIARQLRAGLTTAAEGNHVVGATVRGFSRRRIFLGHTVRNGVGPAITVLGMRFPALLGGAVVTEAVFGMAGYGRFAADSALRGDVPAVQGVLVVSIVLVLVFNVIVNVVLGRLVPASRRGI
jgi:peptide/nickel transport system permease protein